MTHQLVRQNLLDYIILLTISVIWGSAFGAIKVAVEETGPLSLVAARTSLGFVTVAAFLAVTGGWKINAKALPYRRLFAIALIGTAMPFFLIGWAEQYVDSTVAGLLNGAAPLVTVLGAHYITGDELLTKTRLAGVLFGLIGVVLLMHEGLTKVGNASILAQLALVFAFCCYAAGNLLVRGQTALRPAQLTCFSLLITGVLFMPLALIVEQPSPSQWSGEVWLALIWLGAVSTALAFSMRYVLINRAGAGFMSNVGYLIPIVALIIGYFVLGEAISLAKILAMLVIIISLYITRIAGTILRVRTT